MSTAQRQVPRRVHRKTYDLDQQSMQELKELMQCYGEPTEIGAIRRALKDMASMVRIVKDGASLMMEKGGKRTRLLFFESLPQDESSPT